MIVNIDAKQAHISNAHVRPHIYMLYVYMFIALEILIQPQNTLPRSLNNATRAGSLVIVWRGRRLTTELSFINTISIKTLNKNEDSIKRNR